MFDFLKKLFSKSPKPLKVADKNPLSSPLRKPKMPDFRCPFAAHNVKGVMQTKGKYRRGYPEGAVIHFTAGRHGTSAINTALKNNFCYFLIDEDGTIYQNFDLNKWGSHAGESYWPGLGRSVSQYLVGIEITSAGKLDKLGDNKFRSWFGVDIDPKKVRTIKAKQENIEKGHYESFTVEQEDSLSALLVWLKLNNPEVFRYDLVLGHDEVSPNRKPDPGGALSITMPKLRQHLMKLRL